MELSKKILILKIFEANTKSRSQREFSEALAKIHCNNPQAPRSIPHAGRSKKGNGSPDSAKKAPKSTIAPYRKMKKRAEKVLENRKRDESLLKLHLANKANVTLPQNTMKMPAQNVSEPSLESTQSAKRTMKEYDPSHTPWNKGKRFQIPDQSFFGDHHGYFFSDMAKSKET